MSFPEYNPAAVCVYYLCVTVPMMFCSNPLFSLLALAVGIIVLFMYDDKAKASSVLLYIAVPIAGALINPLFNHNGVTVLFVLNDSPVTLEAALYGLSSGLTISAVLVWFRSFTAIMTTDRLLYVFSLLSPKLALILSMTVRYIPLYRRQAEKTRNAQKACGISGEVSLPDKLCGGMRVFSAMVTWALENGVVTADSMTARGYGCVPVRTSFRIFKWFRGDTVLLLLSLAAAAVETWALVAKAVSYVWYPRIIRPETGTAQILFGICAVLCMLIPVIIEGKERLRWKYLQSKI